jgi:hypothetical protein
MREKVSPLLSPNPGYSKTVSSLKLQLRHFLYPPFSSPPGDNWVRTHALKSPTISRQRQEDPLK